MNVTMQFISRSGEPVSDLFDMSPPLRPTFFSGDPKEIAGFLIADSETGKELCIRILPGELKEMLKKASQPDPRYADIQPMQAEAHISFAENEYVFLG